MNILFTRFPLESIHGGGAETQIMHLAKGLRERGHTVTYIGNCLALNEACEEEHIPHIELDIGSPPVTKFEALSFFWRKASIRARLQGMLDTFATVDVVVMLSLTEKLLLTDIARARGLKVFWIEHDPIGRWFTGNPWKPLLKRQAAKAITITVSPLSREQYLDMDFEPRRTVAIPNGIDATWFKEKPTTIRDNTPTLHLGCVARLAREKGIDVLLKAIALEEHVRLDIVGEGSERSSLDALVRHLGIENRVRFVDRQKNLADFYRSLDALVLPSRTVDPFGMAVAEAMSIGVPCLVTDAVGIASCLEQGRDVLVVERDNVAKLAKGIESLQEAKTRRLLSENGRKAAKQQFTISTMVDQYETLFTGRPFSES